MVSRWYIAIVPQVYECIALTRFTQMLKIQVPEIKLPHQPWHLTIVPPFEGAESEAICAFRSLQGLIQPFTARTQGFGYFPEYGCWYLGVEPHPSIISLEQIARESFSTFKLLPRIEPRVYHVTIANDADSDDASSLLAVILSSAQAPLLALRFKSVSLFAKAPGIAPTMVETIQLI